MGTEYGRDWRIKVGDGETSETFSVIAGEQSFDWARTSKEIDETTKDDGIYGSTGFGSQSITISVNGKLKLPDEDGLERLAAVAKTHPPICTVEITKGSVVKFKGSVSVGNFSTTHPDDEVCTWKCDLKNHGAPTTDNLGASS